MNDNHDPTNDSPVQIHSPMAFDFTEGQPPTNEFGKSEAELTVLPPVPFDFSEAVEVPFLKLTLYLRPEADPASLSLDVLRLIDALSGYERDLGGKGMTWDAMRSRATPGSGIVRLVLTPTELHGAQARLAKLATGLAGAATPNPTVPLEWPVNIPSFARWEATVRYDAA